MAIKQTLLFVVGPTAIGKTSIAIEIAKRFKTEVFSADSRQFYKEIPIGTAQPSIDEMQGIPHHFIGNLPLETTWSAATFADATTSLLQKNPQAPFAVVVGGSGLYLSALEYQLDYIPPVDENIRIALNEALQINGLEALSKELQEKDPTYYKEVDVQNPQRVIRALEVIRTTGNTFSSYRTKEKKKNPNFNVVKIGLAMPRDLLYERINKRVDIMMQQGLLKEVEAVRGKMGLNSLNTVAYKELFAYLEGGFSLDEAIEEIKKNTRRFAKRQLTWFRKEDGIHWFHPNQKEEILNFVKSIKTTQV